MTSCAKSTAGKARRTSLSAISSPACGSYPSLIGRSSSKASVWSTRRCGRAVTSPTWISRRAIRYRRAIEELARGSAHSEIDVAREVILIAKRAEADQQAGTAEPDPRSRDPGYYLIGQGRRAFEKELGFRAPMKDWLVRANAVVGISGYLATVAFAAGLLLTLALLAVSCGRSRLVAFSYRWRS